MNVPESSPAPVPPQRSRLPTLGRRGGGWVALQVVIFAVAALAGRFGTPWPLVATPWLWVAGTVAFLAGGWLLVAGGAGLGRQLTPFPRPLPDGELREDGVYALVRHPIYGGVLLSLLAWALVSSPLALAPWTLGAFFFDAKRRREEAWLLAQYPHYALYTERVRRAFVPFLW